jgi:hypothetical protein
VNTSLLKELDYPQVVDQFEVLDLAVYLMDPLGDFQVRLLVEIGARLLTHRW